MDESFIREEALHIIWKTGGFTGLTITDKEINAYTAGYLSALKSITDQKSRIKELEDAVRIEQSGLAAALAEINKAAEGWHWVTEGRGPYPYNDDRYKQETGWMIDTIKGIATKALNKAGIDATNVINSVPKYTIEEVRVAILQHWKKEFGSLDEEKEDESGTLRGPYFVSGFVLAAMESIND